MRPAWTLNPPPSRFLRCPDRRMRQLLGPPPEARYRPSGRSKPARSRAGSSVGEGMVASVEPVLDRGSAGAARSGVKATPVAAAPAISSPPELSIVVPTFNEADNVPILVERLAAALAGVAWEVIFVDDDSPD